MSAERNPGRPARRAVRRWTRRLFLAEWRQQALIIGLLAVAVAAAVVGAAGATNAPPPANAGFGSAQHKLALTPSSGLAATLATLDREVGPIEVIESQALRVPGSVDTFDLRAQDPHGRFGSAMLALVAGRYPAGAGQVAVTSVVASDFHLRVGDAWRLGATTREVVGIVENPQSLLD
ncbi:MAG: ABC transporter permease, partial [Acidobacteriota bacterium]|nr:ABC transporter permease [Acidobacteriota bacterium]